MKNLTDAPQCVRNGIPAHSGRFYGKTIKDDANVRRLRAICRMFGLGPTAIAKAAGVSQPYVSRILSDNDPIVGNPEIYRRLEGKLGGLIDSRSSQFFRVSPLPVRSVEKAVQDISDLAVTEICLKSCSKHYGTSRTR
jgi:transcriptional regulator with XRE-family HTH domain